MLRCLLTMPGTGKQGKPRKMREHFPVREKSGNFVQTGKVREFYPKHWKGMEMIQLISCKNENVYWPHGQKYFLPHSVQHTCPNLHTKCHFYQQSISPG